MKWITFTCLSLAFQAAFAQLPGAATQSKLIEEPAKAQTVSHTPALATKVIDANMAAEEAAISEQMDGLLAAYKFLKPSTSAMDTVLMNVHHFSKEAKPRYSDDVIKLRLSTIPTVIPMDFNPIVERYIDLYTMERREHVSRMLGLGKVYFPLFEENLDRMGLPMELKYLPVVESALNPHARSRVGATGLWQFMLGTAKHYNLEVNTFMDERKDPEKATLAAMKYLKDANEEFGDWLLAIASYNCGPGNVRKAILRSGGKTNFWEIREYLPAETRGYVPAFIAATYTFQYAAEHNLYPVYVDFSLQQDTLQLTGIDVTLQEIAELSGVQVEMLRSLNPELKLDRVPYSVHPYTLRVPRQTSDYFAIHQNEVMAQFGKPRDQYVPQANYGNEYVASRSANPSASATAATPKTTAPPAGKSLVYYTVQSGDVVGAIADKFNVSSNDISAWNSLYHYRIKPGQKLKIYTTRSTQAAVASKPHVTPAPATPGGPAVYHRVRTGDTLWGIASQYEGVKVSDVMTLNEGLDPKSLKPGQTIRVR